MNTLILGNIIALIAASLSVVIGIIKSKKKVLFTQTIQYITYATADFILGGITGAITNLIGIFRNVLCYKEKLSKIIIAIIILISIILTLIFNNLGFIGLLPLFNNIVYTIFINVKDEFKFKILILTQMILWLIYDLTIKAYTSAIFEVITIISCIITGYQIYINRKKEKQQN
jgi:hypothetical protein